MSRRDTRPRHYIRDQDQDQDIEITVSRRDETVSRDFPSLSIGDLRPHDVSDLNGDWLPVTEVDHDRVKVCNGV